MRRGERVIDRQQGFDDGKLIRHKRGRGRPRYSRPGGRRYSFMFRGPATLVGDSLKNRKGAILTTSA